MRQNEPSSNPGRLLTLAFWVSMGGCACVMALEILAAFSIERIWDDAYMFVRYATHMLQGYGVSWDPSNEPTYGLTSLLYLIVVLPVRVLVRGNPAVAACLSSLLSGLVFLALIFKLAWRSWQGPSSLQPLSILLIAAAMAAASPHLAAHFVSGMDTLFSMGYFALYLLLALRLQERPSWGLGLFMGLWGGLALWARPDLLLFTAAIPAVFVLCAPSRPARRISLICLAVTGLVFLCELLAAWRYFGTPFPLPFYVKARNIYGPFFAEQYRGIPMTEILNYLSSYGLLWVIGILGLALGHKASGWRGHPLQKTLSGITVLFVCYHTFFVLQIMHQDQRFYHPTLPALVCLGVWGLSQLIERLPSDLKDACRTHQDRLALVFVFLLSWTLIPKAIQAVWLIKERVRDQSFANFNLLQDAQKNGSITWFCLDKFSMLPDDLVIATTDVGLPCALNLNKTIVDLAGLNEKTFALKDFSPDTLFQKYAPDVLYLPHPHYLEMRDAIGNHPIFQERYEFYPEAVLYRTRNGLGIRKDSPYYPALQKMVRDSMPDWLSWGVDRAHSPTP